MLKIKGAINRTIAGLIACPIIPDEALARLTIEKNRKPPRDVRAPIIILSKYSLTANLSHPPLGKPGLGIEIIEEVVGKYRQKP